MKFIYTSITIPLLVLIGIFAAANRESVIYNLFPLPYVLELPLFLLPFLLFIAGFMIGGFVVWNSDRRYRRIIREDQIKFREMEEEAKVIRRRLNAVLHGDQKTSPEDVRRQKDLIESFPTNKSALAKK
jgi:uncharacterized integral membrane protein